MPPSPDSPGTHSDAITTDVPESPEEPDSEENAFKKESKEKKERGFASGKKRGLTTICNYQLKLSTFHNH